MEEKSSSKLFLENILSSLPYLRPLKNFILKIMNLIPRIFKKGDPLTIKYLYNFVEFIVLLISVIVIQTTSGKNINIFNRDIKYSTTNLKQIEPGLLSLKDVESVIYVLFIVLIIFNVIHTTYMHLFNKELKGLFGTIYNIPLYIIVFFSSLILYILINSLRWIQELIDLIINFVVYLFDQIKEILNDKVRAITFIKYLLLYVVIISIIILLFSAKNDSGALNNHTFIYAIFIIIPLIVVLYYSTPISTGQSSSVNFLVSLMIGIFFSIIIYYYLKLNSSTSLAVNYVTSIIIIIIVILGLTNIFYILGNYFRSFTGWTGFFINFIFYIPCLLIEFIKYVMNEFKLTANPIYVILFLEFIAILIYIYLPQLLKKVYISDGVVLLPESSFLNIKEVISNNNMHRHVMPKTKDPNLTFTSVLNKSNTFSNWITTNIKSIFNNSKYNVDYNNFNQVYSFSMWIYINQQTLNTNSEIEIFNFGKNNNSDPNSREGKPRITYYNNTSFNENKNGKNSKDLLRVYFTNQTNPKGYYDFKIVKQKWNNIVLNISLDKADIFLNGKIEYTYYYNNNPPLNDVLDFITIGKDDGLNGAICNIVYYPRNLSVVEITNNYNILMLKNPPIN